jgi:hypothetical protein
MCFEVGHHTKKNKLVFFYFTIGNLPTKFRSAFKFINALAICYNTTLLQHGANFILQPILDNIKKLEAGYEFVIGGERKIIHGTLAALVADNSASHQIGGFNVGFSNGFRKCRFCLTTREDIQEKCFDTEHIPRTKENHDMQCDGLDLEDPDLQARWSTLYGIKNRCILNDLRGFHVIGGCVSDLMHDTLEGILSVTICALLECCIFKKKYFTLGQLNNILANFQYVKVEARDKPSKIEPLHLKFSDKKTKRTLNLKNRKKKLKQSATQLWLLGVNLP